MNSWCGCCGWPYDDETTWQTDNYWCTRCRWHVEAPPGWT